MQELTCIQMYKYIYIYLEEAMMKLIESYSKMKLGTNNTLKKNLGFIFGKGTMCYLIQKYFALNFALY